MSPTVADALGFCLSMGLLDVKDIEAITEREIANTARPSRALIELAFCTQRADAISQLHHLASGSEKSAAATLILDVLKNQWCIEPQNLRLVARVLEQMAQFGYLPDTDCQWTMVTLAEDLAAVAAGDYAVELADSICQQTLDFLTRYAPTTLQQVLNGVLPRII